MSVLALAFSVLGWLAMSGDCRNRVLVVSLRFIAIFLFAGRPDTAYWGRLYVPLLMPGRLSRRERSCFSSAGTVRARRPSRPEPGRPKTHQVTHDVW